MEEVLSLGMHPDDVNLDILAAVAYENAISFGTAFEALTGFSKSHPRFRALWEQYRSDPISVYSLSTLAGKDPYDPANRNGSCF